MKNTILILSVLFIFTGCASLQRALYDTPTPSVNAQGEAITPPLELKPGVEAAINLAGDSIPVPWAGLVASGLVHVLTAYGSFRGRKWKQATNSAVMAGNELRKVVKKVAPDKYAEIKARIIGDQNTSGTRREIKRVLADLN